ncbi:MAG: hypothetical protein M9913_09445 [Bryobacteraceae bacterium]|nr:hypothetical protein [Solibacteraceae bacterium]MCO5351108.1 hypothetical protein [Bryobacteraceae bacterium]
MGIDQVAQRVRRLARKLARAKEVVFVILVTPEYGAEPVPVFIGWADGRPALTGDAAAQWGEARR